MLKETLAGLAPLDMQLHAPIDQDKDPLDGLVPVLVDVEHLVESELRRRPKVDASAVERARREGLADVALPLRVDLHAAVPHRPRGVLLVELRAHLGDLVQHVVVLLDPLVEEGRAFVRRHGS